jgi:class 3 adenylate cyclase
VAALAEPGEVLVSRTVVDLVAGSGLQFDDSGSYVLKGVPRRMATLRGPVMKHARRSQKVRNFA